MLDDGLCQSPFDVLRGGPWKIGLWRRHVLGGHHFVSAGVLDVLRGGPWRRHVMGGHYAVPVLVDRLWGGPW